MPPAKESLPVSRGYAPSVAGAAEARYIFVEATPGHRYLYDPFDDLPGARLITFPLRLGHRRRARSASTRDFASLYRSIRPTTKAIFFLTLNQMLFNAQREEFLRFVAASPVAVHGILHILPEGWTKIKVLKPLDRLTGRVCFLSEAMAEQAASVLGLSNACYLPHHPTSYAHSCSSSERDTLRAELGVQPDQRVFSVIGEARRGKGIDLLIAALEHIPIPARRRMFFLIAGKAKHYHAKDLRARLLAAGTAGSVDLREASDYLTYEVLTQGEYANYVAVSDIGLLLYQQDQRTVMSGVLGDYVWAGRRVIATQNSYTGAEVQRNDLGTLVDSEDPETLAGVLTGALRTLDRGDGLSALATAYRDRIAPDAVRRRLQEILDSDGDPARAAKFAGSPFISRVDRVCEYPRALRMILGHTPRDEVRATGRLKAIASAQREQLEQPATASEAGKSSGPSERRDAGRPDEG